MGLAVVVTVPSSMVHFLTRAFLSEFASIVVWISVAREMAPTIQSLASSIIFGPELAEASILLNPTFSRKELASTITQTDSNLSC